MVELSTESLLIVEDKEVTREGLSAIVSRQGYSIRGGANSAQAMEALREEKPDLILLGMLLPGSVDRRLRQ